MDHKLNRNDANASWTSDRGLYVLGAIDPVERKFEDLWSQFIKTGNRVWAAVYVGLIC